ncbi:hypothetical protein [Virgisporangium ochraceum]|nr:hypothetical protein [Virgisporangium ochraceum]
MFRIRRGRTVDVGVQFCERCAEVTTAAQRAQTRHDRVRTDALRWSHGR